MSEHGILPPASLQSNDAPKVLSLTLTTAYKRDQYLPLGQHKEMEFFITEWRWEQRVWRKIKNEPWAPQTKMKLRYTRKRWAVLQNYSCLASWQQQRYCGFYAENSVQLLFFPAFEDLHSEVWMSSSLFSMSEYLVFLCYGTYCGQFSWKSADPLLGKDSKVCSSLSQTRIVFVSAISFEC